MASLDTNDSFIILWAMWRFVGVHPYERLKWLYNLYSIIANFLTSIVSPTILFMNIFFLDDLASIMHNLQISPTLIVCTLKQVAVWAKLTNLKNVKPFLRELDRRAILNLEDTLFLKKIIRQCHIIVIAIKISLFSSLMSYAVPAFIHHKTVFEGWFPFDVQASSGLFYLAFGFQYFSTWFQVVQNAASDAYPLVYIHVINSHIRVLCRRVARIGKDPRTSQEENYAELKACVNDHKNIIGLFDTVSPVISLTVLIQFVITAIVLCISLVYFLLFNRTSAQLVSMIVYIAGVTSETFPVCYLGNTLIVETNRLTTAIYECNWMDQTNKFRKCVVIFMQRSQKNNVFVAGLTTISLQTFIGIIQFSFSVFTVLSRINK